ncbi:hypothetical protein BX600DRAFT_500505 [Xylariales sp. PMI_506]|nr:hypothetical protein BX600DRAFT_500505 [Xylariales sp. PMI_506]
MAFVTVPASAQLHSKQIAAFLDTVWPGEHHSIGDITVSLSAENHRAFVALESAQTSTAHVVGFVDGFHTTSPATGVRRWELDLLAVDPDHRGRGIGRGLVEASVEAGRSMGCNIIRALVRVDNMSCHHTLMGCKFAPNEEVVALQVCDELPRVLGNPPAGTDIIPVQTCNYHGYWLEGNLNPRVLQEVVKGVTSESFPPSEKDKRQDAVIIGALLPTTEHDELPPKGFSEVGKYQWWFYTL